MWKGYFYMIVLVLINLLKTLLTSQHIYQLATMGLRIRSALTNSLFKKSLTLNSKARQERTGNFKAQLCNYHANWHNWLIAGETVNLMSIDSTRIEQLATNINTIWTSPLTICLSLYFLWGYLGPASLAGLVVMVVLIPVNGVLSSQMKKYQIANMKNKDTRIKVRKRNLFFKMSTYFPWKCNLPWKQLLRAFQFGWIIATVTESRVMHFHTIW